MSELLVAGFKYFVVCLGAWFKEPAVEDKFFGVKPRPLAGFWIPLAFPDGFVIPDEQPELDALVDSVKPRVEWMDGQCAITFPDDVGELPVYEWCVLPGEESEVLVSDASTQDSAFRTTCATVVDILQRHGIRDEQIQWDVYATEFYPDKCGLLIYDSPSRLVAS